MTPQEFHEWRLRMNWSQQEAAKQLGRSDTAIQWYEYGKSDIPLAIELATFELDRRFGGRPANKGCHLGQCNKAGCTQHGATWFNRRDGLYYCKRHALDINQPRKSSPGRDAIEVCVEHKP